MRPPARLPRSRSATASRLLDAAEALAQTRGYNGFSYADVAADVGITTASLHYHFPTKADLGRALVERYTATFASALLEVAGAGNDALGRLRGYAGLYERVLTAGRMCLCGMLAAEYATLPSPVQRAVRGFFDANDAWLTDVFAQGRARGTLAFSGSARDAAQVWTSTLEGALLLARSYGDPARFTTAVARSLEPLAPRTRERSSARGTQPPDSRARKQSPARPRRSTR